MRGWGDSPRRNKIGKKNIQIFWSPTNSQVPPPILGRKRRQNGRGTRCFDQKVIFFVGQHKYIPINYENDDQRCIYLVYSFVRTEELCPKQMHFYRIFDNSKSVKFIYIDDICAT